MKRGLIILASFLSASGGAAQVGTRYTVRAVQADFPRRGEPQVLTTRTMPIVVGAPPVRLPGTDWFCRATGRNFVVAHCEFEGTTIAARTVVERCEDEQAFSLDDGPVTWTVEVGCD